MEIDNHEVGGFDINAIDMDALCIFPESDPMDLELHELIQCNFDAVFDSLENNDLSCAEPAVSVS
ncbi:hypothetical protein [Candidatus Magnetaquiglobus chichijimensis]